MGTSAVPGSPNLSWTDLWHGRFVASPCLRVEVLVNLGLLDTKIVSKCYKCLSYLMCKSASKLLQ
jgi:hypothetical protein